jgi:hypothetical protein
MINRTSDAYGVVQGGDTSASGVSWGAILAGAFAAAALSFILIILGFGLGFSAVSPWSDSGASAQTIGVSTIIWIAFTQIAASAMGGYMAGRLRVKWGGTHSDEVYFRDTAHGFLAWAVATLVTAALLTSAIGGVLSGGAKVAGAAGTAIATTGAAAGAGMANSNSSGSGGSGDSSSYFIDSLFRPASNGGSGASAGAPDATGSAANGVAMPMATGSGMGGGNSSNAGGGSMGAGSGDNGAEMSGQQRTEVTRIFANALRTGSLSDADRNYVAQILAKRTGMSQAEAVKRVNDTYANYSKVIDDAKTEAKSAADKARKAAAYSALWMFVALLCGAFIASLSATFGGRLRDRVVMVENRDAAYTTNKSTL